MQSPSVPRQRTVAIIILAVIATVAGISAVLDTLRFLGLFPMRLWGELEFYSVSWLGAILSGILAVIWFTVARELWVLDKQGWLFVVLVATLNLILLLLSWLGDSSFQSVLPGLVINALALVLGLLPSTKAAFGIPSAPPR